MKLTKKQLKEPFNPALFNMYYYGWCGNMDRAKINGQTVLATILDKTISGTHIYKDKRTQNVTFTLSISCCLAVKNGDEHKECFVYDNVKNKEVLNYINETSSNI